MQWTWLIIAGISIRMAVDVARYAALRANRQSDHSGVDARGHEAAVAAEPIAIQAAADLPATPLIGGVRPPLSVAARRALRIRVQARTAHHKFLN
jgi:hypothetical protein